MEICINEAEYHFYSKDETEYFKFYFHFEKFTEEKIKLLWKYLTYSEAYYRESLKKKEFDMEITGKELYELITGVSFTKDEKAKEIVDMMCWCAVSAIPQFAKVLNNG